jgi:hypothetical protein
VGVRVDVEGAPFVNLGDFDTLTVTPTGEFGSITVNGPVVVVTPPLYAQYEAERAELRRLKAVRPTRRARARRWAADRLVATAFKLSSESTDRDL